MKHSNGKPQEDDHYEEITYFLPDQVILHLEHPLDYPPKRLAEDLQNFFKQNDGVQPWTRLIPPEAEAILTFPFARGDSKHSFVPVHLVNADADKNSITSMLVEIFEKHRGKPILIREINQQKININSATLNWLAGGSSHGIGVSGPGAWPKQAHLASGKRAKFFEDKQILGEQPVCGSGINIAILDTAPCLSELVAAYEKWRKPEAERNHCLIDSLLRPRGNLHVYPASLEELRLAAPYILLGHPYSVADHGLFVAGIIHTLAPHANLHLYEVLNPSGVGCILNIFKGLIRAMELRSNSSPLIINCSLVLGLQRDDDITNNFRLAFGDHELPAKFLKYLRQPMEIIFEQIERENVVVVAAAGNDAQGDLNGNFPTGRPPARYPAALQSVIGVGSIQHPQGGQVKIASYSNLASDQDQVGYLTLGGEEGKPKGVRGIYISPFPHYNGPQPRPRRNIKAEQVSYHPNDTGWAWWAGTSFAAPVVTGILAKWWNIGNQTGLLGAKSVLDKFAEAANNSQSEKVIIVNQKEETSCLE
jgi:hypothetical protein